MSSLTCPLCGLRYPARSLLDLHIREDHAQFGVFSSLSLRSKVPPF